MDGALRPFRAGRVWRRGRASKGREGGGSPELWTSRRDLLTLSVPWRPCHVNTEQPLGRNTEDGRSLVQGSVGEWPMELPGVGPEWPEETCERQCLSPLLVQLRKTREMGQELGGGRGNSATCDGRAAQTIGTTGGSRPPSQAPARGWQSVSRALCVVLKFLNFVHSALEDSMGLPLFLCLCHSLIHETTEARGLPLAGPWRAVHPPGPAGSLHSCPSRRGSQGSCKQ